MSQKENKTSIPWYMNMLPINEMTAEFKEGAVDTLKTLAEEKFGHITADPGTQKALLIFNDENKLAAGLVFIDVETKEIKKAVKKYDVSAEIQALDFKKLLQ